MSDLKFGVLGAGVIGLTTSLELQNRFPNSRITIIADKFNKGTTSDGAAGIFRPGTSFSTHSEEATKYIIEESYQYYEKVVSNFEPSVTGVSQVSGYIFSSNSPSLVENELINKIVPVYRPASEDELKLCPGDWKYGSYFTTVLTECRKFLPWCLKRYSSYKLLALTSNSRKLTTKSCDGDGVVVEVGFKMKTTSQNNNGGKVLTEKISTMNDVKKYNFDLVFNCSGFGAKDLLKDRKLVPIRGQVLKVSAPWLKNFFYADYDTYIIPGLENVTLGGCRHYDSYETTVSPYDTAAIWDRCVKLMPKLRECSIEREWVGLRPHRDPVRIEPELIQAGSDFIKCIHNYGHGGYGVTTAPGSAKLAVDIGMKFLRGITSKL